MKQAGIERAGLTGSILPMLARAAVQNRSARIGSRYVSNPFGFPPLDHSSLPSASSVPVLMLAMSFISFSLIGIGPQARTPRVQTIIPFLASS